MRMSKILAANWTFFDGETMDCYIAGKKNLKSSTTLEILKGLTQVCRSFDESSTSQEESTDFSTSLEAFSKC